MGTKKRPFWRIVAIDTRGARDGRFIEIVGYYNPMVNPAEIKVDEDRVYHWLNNGALPSEKVGQLLRKLGLMERWRLLREGVKIHELDAKVAERRLKQPKPAVDREKKKKPGKKGAAKSEEAAPEASAPKEGDAGATT
jgi:small subunit ribosomal protein S16